MRTLKPSLVTFHPTAAQNLKDRLEGILESLHFNSKSKLLNHGTASRSGELREQNQIVGAWLFLILSNKSGATL